MNINADFSQRVFVQSRLQPWIASPMQGVERRPLDRIGDEVARATSIVRYAPGSHFSPHVHKGGEEFVVLEGVFQDENGDYPAGSYIRNPPQSTHTPGSQTGCVIFVKLWQFDSKDRQHVNTLAQVDNSLSMQAFIPPVNASINKVLYQNKYEKVSVYELAPQVTLSLGAEQGIEVLVLDGEFTEGKDTLEQHSWLRLPINTTLSGYAGNNGARLWIKSQHLSYVNEQIARVKNA